MSDDYRRLAADAARTEQAAKAVIRHLDRYPELAAALEELELPRPEFESRGDEAGREAAHYEVIAEVYERMGHVVGVSCGCGHRPNQHARRLTGDYRLPCEVVGCGCEDLVDGRP